MPLEQADYGGYSDYASLLQATVCQLLNSDSKMCVFPSSPEKTPCRNHSREILGENNLKLPDLPHSQNIISREPADQNIAKNIPNTANIFDDHKSALHIACSLPSAAVWVKRICAGTGWNPGTSGYNPRLNERNNLGQTPLHVLVSGEPHADVGEAASTLLRCGADPNAIDSRGDSVLLCLRGWMQAEKYDAALSVAKVLICHGADCNAVTREGRTLLTYSVWCLDDSLSMTRLLLNSSASAWHGEADQSAFAWFLRAIIRRRRLENHAGTLRLLSLTMGENPRRMHSHVLRTMFRQVRCYRVLGPVFLQLKLEMNKYWTEPNDLRYLCFRTIRKSLGSSSRDLGQTATLLGLPKQLENYVLMK